MTMPSLDDIMKMAEAAQQQLAQAQENLDKVEVEGVSGGGLWRFTRDYIPAPRWGEGAGKPCGSG